MATYKNSLEDYCTCCRHGLQLTAKKSVNIFFFCLMLYFQRQISMFLFILIGYYLLSMANDFVITNYWIIFCHYKMKPNKLNYYK